MAPCAVQVRSTHDTNVRDGIIDLLRQGCTARLIMGRTGAMMRSTASALLLSASNTPSTRLTGPNMAYCLLVTAVATHV